MSHRLKLNRGVACLLIGLGCVNFASSSASAGGDKGQTLIVVNKMGDNVAFFDATDHRRLESIPLPTHPHELQLSRDKRTAYISIYGDGIFTDNVHPGHQVYVIDVASRKIKGIINTGDFIGPHGMALDAHGLLWVTCDKSNCVIVVDPEKREVLKDVPTHSQGSHWIAMLPDGTKAYTSNKFNPYLSVLDTASRKMIKKIPLPNGSEGVAVSPDGKFLYVCDHKEAIIYVVDTATDEIVRHKRMEGLPGTPPHMNPEARVAASPDGKWLLISMYSIDRLVVLDAADLSQKKVFQMGKGPMGFAFPKDRSKAYVTNHDAGTISVINLNKLEIEDNFATSKKPVSGPETMAFVE